MGLLSFLSKSKTSHDILADDDKIVELFAKHIETYAIREKLAKSFNYGNVLNAQMNFEDTVKILNQIKDTILQDIHTLEAEDVLIGDILHEFSMITASPSLQVVHRTVLDAADREAELRKIFVKMERIIELELKMIKYLTLDERDRKELFFEKDKGAVLIKLFELIFHREAEVNALFNPHKYFEETKKKHEQIMTATKSMILGQKVEIIVKTQAEVFAEMMVQKLKNETRNKYHNLAIDIFRTISELAGWPDADAGDVITRIDDYLRLPQVMHDIVKKLRPKYTDIEIEGAIIAFKQAYSEDHFEDIISDIARGKIPLGFD